MMDNLPLVSIVTPARNSARYIAEAIESICNQDYPAIQHIVIDGASSDDTIQILKQYSHLIWVSEPDRGQSDALNKGFRIAQGEILGWLNADDSYNAEAISKVVSYFQGHSGVDVVYGDCQVVDEYGQPIRISRSRPFDLARLLMENYIPQPTVFMRRRVLDAVGGVDERLHFVMDWELWLRVGVVFRMDYLSHCILANYRLCPGTKSFEQNPQFALEWLEVLDRVFQTSPFDQMPHGSRREARNKAWGRHYMARVYAAYRDRKMSEVRHCLLRAVAYDWTWAANKGVWSLIVEAFLGRSLARTIRRVV